MGAIDLTPLKGFTARYRAWSEEEETAAQKMRIRMLTETECERLQGFPDGFTRYGIYDGVKAEIGRKHRYALLGNAVSVPVVAEVAGKIKETTLF